LNFKTGQMIAFDRDTVIVIFTQGSLNITFVPSYPLIYK